VVRTPTAEPRTICLLGVEQPEDASLGGPAAPPEDRKHLDDVGRDVCAGWIDELAEVAEGELPAQSAGVIDIECGPTPVPTLHAVGPRDGTCHRIVIDLIGAAKSENNLRRVIDVGVIVVGELERPPTGSQIGSPYAPVASHRDLLVEQPASGFAQRRVVRGHTGVGERHNRQGGVPNRGLARLDAPARLIFDGKCVETVEPGLHHRVVEWIALEMQCHQ
jgi:hypothetical protein